ncbi:cobyrinic acid a,c-diamide synthase [Burkholderia ambifaria MEX-5]|uniref:Cobyrinic acid a,c-diamide synthase n=1 Tax=Burkholderia ambifaria MEX-5 TaxID=396597 RepID=B1TES2_9BURK|nr:cobyrinic acid a,c-diamide synthase [Burkholderia ambifaria MEX-5]
MLLERASGAPVHALDLGMVGEAGCRALLADAARDADLILIEGVMGLFDGTPSSADLAAAFGVPVVAVISAKAMAQTFAAIAFGLARFRPEVPFHGVLANRVGSPRHAELLRQALPDDLRWLGHVPADAGIALPERHLGLHQPADIGDLDARLDRAADVLAQTALADLPPAVSFAEPAARAPLPRALAGKRIAIARDAAFSFIYPANLALLDALGAQLRFFSPLADEPVPDECDALFLPGGYPELHAATLAANAVAARTIRAHAAAAGRSSRNAGNGLSVRVADRRGRRDDIDARAAVRPCDDAAPVRGARHAATGHAQRADARPYVSLFAARHAAGAGGERRPARRGTRQRRSRVSHGFDRRDVHAHVLAVESGCGGGVVQRGWVVVRHVPQLNRDGPAPAFIVTPETSRRA